MQNVLRIPDSWLNWIVNAISMTLYQQRFRKCCIVGKEKVGLKAQPAAFALPPFFFFCTGLTFRSFVMSAIINKAAEMLGIGYLSHFYKPKFHTTVFLVKK